VLINNSLGGLDNWLRPLGTSEAKVPSAHNTGRIAFCIFAKQFTVRFVCSLYLLVQTPKHEFN